MENLENKVVVTKEDIKGTRDFLKHFNIPCPDYLNEIMDDMLASDTITSTQQDKLKIAISRALVENKDHKILKDELFEEAIPNCQEVWYNAKFDQELEESLSRDTDDDNQ